MEQGRFLDALITNAMELLGRWLSDRKVKGRRVITYGRWRIVKDLTVVPVVQNESFSEANFTARLLMDRIRELIEAHPETKDDDWAVSSFFAREFAKEVRQDEDDYNYLLSAAFSERMINKGKVDGILYQSVPTGRQGWNVAITPEAADTCIELVAVGEYSAYNYYGNSLIDPDVVVELMPNQITFELVPKLESDHIGRDTWLHDLGLRSIDDVLSV